MYLVSQGADRYGPYADLRIALVVADSLPRVVRKHGHASAATTVTVTDVSTGMSYYTES